MSSSSRPWITVTSHFSRFFTTSKYPSILQAVPKIMLCRVCHAALCVWQQNPSTKYVLILHSFMSLVRKSQTRWFLQMRRHTVRLTCSYQHATDDPNAIGGHTRLGANCLIVYCVARSPLGAGELTGASNVRDLTSPGCFTASARAKMQPKEWATMWKDLTL
nr:hypothetical protein Iba_chr05eCG10000 [Ipomoea batatas]